MAKKNAIPKKVAGFKIPRSIRKSSFLRSMLASKTGRDILGKALLAGAGAAAAVLAEERSEIAQAGKKGARKGARVVGIAGEAIQSAAHAAMDVVADQTRSIFPANKKKEKDDRPLREAVRH
ncbi:hypothetical protein [Neorhizobium alkalisoli]|uniref:hypothetical protein n=1 Tax=Neorhizobium alkalisoli TaxID=528178 RepID=UPI000CFA7DC9|nr:hypothetical protein [Neorhizobium alkalisoli]